MTLFLIACIHEIIGHFYLRVNQYLYPDEKISSPMPIYPSDYAKERGKESGEVVEDNLFGNYQNFLRVHTKSICPNCKMILNRDKIRGRMTYYCKNCQR